MGVQAAEQDGVGHWQQRSLQWECIPALRCRSLPINDSMDDAGVTNPFYSEPEILPVPEPYCRWMTMPSRPIPDDAAMDESRKRSSTKHSVTSRSQSRFR